MARVFAMLRGGRAAGITLLIGILAGCAAPRDATPPLLRAAAVQTRTGEEAYLTGRAGEASPALGEAVRLHLAAGDLPGAARALLNLALAQRAAGDATSAAATAARLRELTPAAGQQIREQGGKDETSAEELAAASAWLDALLTLDRGDSASAAVLLASVASKFPASSPWNGRIETLRAECALGAGQPTEALAHARAGQAASSAAHDRAEEARALRFAGAAEMRLGQWTEARADFLAAVRIEELLGGGARMAGDLNQLAAISEQLGDRSAAQLYAQRARAIVSAR